MGAGKSKLENGSKSGPGGKTAGQARKTTTPSWRQIEALRERRALKDELADIWSENPELDEDIFSSGDEEHSRFYQRPAKLKDVDFEVDEDAEPEDDD